MLAMPLLSHYGIVVNAEKGIIADFGSRGKRIVSICDFMAGKHDFAIHNSNVIDETPSAIKARFYAIKPGPFTLQWNNCADFMKHFGRPDLYHVEVMKLLAIVATTLTFILIVIR